MTRAQGALSGNGVVGGVALSGSILLAMRRRTLEDLDGTQQCWANLVEKATDSPLSYFRKHGPAQVVRDLKPIVGARVVVQNAKNRTLRQCLRKRRPDRLLNRLTSAPQWDGIGYHNHLAELRIRRPGQDAAEQTTKRRPLVCGEYSHGDFANKYIAAFASQVSAWLNSPSLFRN